MITKTPPANVTRLARQHPLGFPALVITILCVLHGTTAPGALTFPVCNIEGLDEPSVGLPTTKAVCHNSALGPFM